MSGSSSILDRIANPTTLNPLDAFSKALTVNNALNQNKLFQAKQAAGQAFQSSLNPDGSTNQATLLQNLKADPSAALYAPETAQAGQTLSADEYGQQVKRMAYGASGFMQILAENNGTAPYQAVKDYYDRAVQDGHLTAADEAKVMQGFGPDALANASVGRQRVMQNIQSQEAMTRGMPQPGQQDLGGSIRTIDTNPNTNPGGPGSVGSTVYPTTNPAYNADLVKIPDPNHPGATLLVPRSSLPGASGRGVPGAPVAPGGPPSAFPNGGRVPPALTNPNATPGTTTPPPAAGNPTSPTPAGTAGATPDTAPVPAGAVPGSPDPNLVAKNAADVNAYQTAQQGTQASAGDRVTLGHALDALKLLQDARLSTGPTTDTMHRMYATLQTFGALPQGMTDNVANWELAKKALTAYAASAGTAAHTDLGLATAAASNASVDGVTNQAAQTVVKQRLGQINQSLAMVNEAPDRTGVGYNSHASSFVQNTDPRAFNFDDYTPAERAAIVKSLGSKDSPAYKNFTRSLVIAQRNQMITPPGSNAAGQ